MVFHTTLYCRGHHDRKHAFWAALHKSEFRSADTTTARPSKCGAVVGSLVLQDAARVTAYKITLNLPVTYYLLDASKLSRFDFLRCSNNRVCFWAHCVYVTFLACFLHLSCIASEASKRKLRKNSI